MEGSNNTTQESREPFVVRCEPMITNLLGKKNIFLPVLFYIEIPMFKCSKELHFECSSMCSVKLIMGILCFM